MQLDIDNTLAGRGALYGQFAGNAALSQGLKVVMAAGRNWEPLEADQREALEMIATKIGRILNGYPDHVDSWKDISGYSLLIADRLAAEEVK